MHTLSSGSDLYHYRNHVWWWTPLTSTLKPKAKESEVQGHSWLHIECEANLGYMGTYLKIPNLLKLTRLVMTTNHEKATTKRQQTKTLIRRQITLKK